MLRFAVASFVLLLAAPAQAAPRPLRVVHGSAQVALAGETVLFTEVRGRTLSVKAMPVAGGRARTVFTHRGPRGTTAYGLLEASAQRVAVTFVADDRWQVFSGPPGRPYTAVAPATRDDLTTQVDGDRLFVTAVDGEKRTVTAYDPAAQAIPFEGDDARRTSFAGDLVAHTHRLPGDDEPDLPSGVQVRNWRTGAVLSETRFPTEIDAVALRPDGRAVVSAAGILYELLPGGTPRRISEGSLPRFAGERAVYVDTLAESEQEQLRIAEPRGRSHAFGALTTTLRSFAADEQHVAWVANDCLVIASPGDPAVDAIGPGPCARSEFDFIGPGLSARCVAAPHGVCRARLRLLDRRGRAVSGFTPVRIAVGRSGTPRWVKRRPGGVAVEVRWADGTRVVGD